MRETDTGGPTHERQDSIKKGAGVICEIGPYMDTVWPYPENFHEAAEKRYRLSLAEEILRQYNIQVVPVIPDSIHMSTVKKSNE